MTPSGAAVVNALTIDVEEYFHPNAMDATVAVDDWASLPSRVEGNTLRLLDLLDRHRVRATCFVLGWVAERWPALVREIARRGHELACHGYAHRLVYQLGATKFRADVARGKAILEDCVGQPVIGFRAASYSITADALWALDILVEEGFAYDSSIFPVHHDLYGIPGFSRFPVRVRCAAGEIVEIPPSTVRLLGNNLPVAGGGYFRLFPYAVTRWAIERINRRDRAPAIVYVHPWELDVDQPRLPAPARSRLRHYANLRATAPRLHRLLDDFRFAPLSAVIEPPREVVDVRQIAGAAGPRMPLGTEEAIRP